MGDVKVSRVNFPVFVALLFSPLLEIPSHQAIGGPIAISNPRTWKGNERKQIKTQKHKKSAQKLDEDKGPLTFDL